MLEKKTLGFKEFLTVTGYGRDKGRAVIKAHPDLLPNIGSARRILIPKVAVEKFIESGGRAA